MRGCRVVVAAILFLLGPWFTSRGLATPHLPLTKNGECRTFWRGRGFSSEGPSGRNTLFRPGEREAYREYYRRLDRENCWKEWLIVIYMAADNDLSPYSFRDLWEMESVGSAPSVDVVAFHDSAGDGTRYFHIAKNPRVLDIENTLRAFVRQEGLEQHEPQVQEEAFWEKRGLSLVVSPVVKLSPESDSGDIRTAGEFLLWAFKKYPSRRIMLVGWSHGEGFDAKKTDARPSGRQGGFAFDYSSKTHMHATEMSEGLKRLLEKTRAGKEIDILGSDACLNQQAEFAYEWKGTAEYLFGSSTIVQKKGFNYHSLLGWFSEHPLQPTAELAKKIPLLYGQSVKSTSHGKYSSYYDPSATMATWVVSELTFLKRAMDALGNTLFDWLDVKDELQKIQRQEEMRKVIAKSLRLGAVSNDLFNFLQVLEVWAKEKDLKDIANAINTARRCLHKSVLEKYIGEKYQRGLLRTSLGVGIWLPTSDDEFEEMFPKFERALLYQTEAEPKSLSEWGRFLKAIYR